MNPRPKVAVMYDFDKTLSTQNMQEFNFIGNVGMDPVEFWSEAGKLAEEEGMDPILAYMFLMVSKSKEAGREITKDSFKNLGKGVQYYKGVEDWFDLINNVGNDLGLDVEHYIISSGVKEIIEGTSIFKHFREVFACEFHYDEDGNAVWPKNAVNFTNKTQFIFRINKGALDLSDNRAVNEFVLEDERPIPFFNMIYIGDGDTDIPSMKLVKQGGGYSIAVYPIDNPGVAKHLVSDGRANFFCEADYSEGSELFCTVSDIMSEIAAHNKLVRHERSDLIKSKD